MTARLRKAGHSLFPISRLLPNAASHALAMLSVMTEMFPERRRVTLTVAAATVPIVRAAAERRQRPEAKKFAMLGGARSLRSAPPGAGPPHPR